MPKAKTATKKKARETPEVATPETAQAARTTPPVELAPPKRRGEFRCPQCTRAFAIETAFDLEQAALHLLERRHGTVAELVRLGRPQRRPRDA